jgi:hypothetical protein
MEKRFTSSKDARTQTGITFWFYVGSLPIIAFLFILPFIRAGQFAFSPYSLIYILIFAFLLFSGYRAMRVMQAVKNSYCVIDGERVYGVSTPSPYRSAIPFDIQKKDILGIGKTTVSTGGMRTQEALVLNTETQTIVLFAIDRIKELKDELQTKSAE